MPGALLAQFAVVWTLVGGGVLEPRGDTAALYRAPTTVSGQALIIATRLDTGRADTSVVSFVAGGSLAGIPFGHFKEPAPGSPLRSGGYLIVPQGQLAQLPMIRARGGRVIVNVIGGGSCSLDASGQWRMDLWQACWRRNLPTALRDTVLKYSQAGTVVGTYLIDEPNLVKRWGTITPQQVCQMAAYARQELPGIPVLVRAAATWLGSCAAIDAAWSQYASRRETPAEDYRREHLETARARGYRQVFSLNALNDDASGTPMTAQQVTGYGTVLLRADPLLCAFYVWEYATTWSERPEIRTALDSLGRLAQRLPAISCRRSP